jgi:hypothetical protein
MIALYQKWIFQANESSHISKMYSYVDRPVISFLGKWEEDEKSFFKYFHKKLPNESIRVFKDKKRPIPKLLRHNIEHFMKTNSEFIETNRDEKIHELLNQI